jgi:hypothetical protein
MLRTAIIAAASTLLIAGSSQAALLRNVEGKVLLNKGDGFWEVFGKTPVTAGDRVLVRGKGSAEIDYGEGCVSKVSANETAIVAQKKSCNRQTPVPMPARQMASLKDTGPMASLKDIGPIALPPSLNDSSPDGHAIVIGGLVVAGGLAAAAALDGDEHNKIHTPVPVPLEEEQTGISSRAALATVLSLESGAPLSP